MKHERKLLLEDTSGEQQLTGLIALLLPWEIIGILEQMVVKTL
jgi:hypothetical protein